MNTNAITTSGLTKRYGSVSALEHLDLEVPSNTIFGFLGPNGAGKTTTIKTLLGLIRPSAGTGTILDRDIVRDSVAIRERVGYLPQQPTFYKEMTAREALRFTATFFYKASRKAVEHRIDETLELVGLDKLADRRVGVLSGGERQRLGIAQAQINHPDLLILDEPAAALDPIGRRDVLTIMNRLRKHTTVFFSTHILDDVQQVSDGVAILSRGRSVAQGATADLLAGGEKSVFHVLLRGQTDQLRKQIEALPWVEDVDDKTGEMGEAGHASWHVVVSDRGRAEAELFRNLAADSSATVLEYGTVRYELEDVFMKLVQGEADE
ncbi:MAG: ATP-binding cassette domain-containing protein [Spirochaetes bacterium]|jgi:ABC-2 type transport system ATP-binding protein|nr:ATP-binding cassette domain-containing protein [Spirochaetota bacterium]